jgi:hypothetical protein
MNQLRMRPRNSDHPQEKVTLSTLPKLPIPTRTRNLASRPDGYVYVHLVVNSPCWRECLQRSPTTPRNKSLASTGTRTLNLPKACKISETEQRKAKKKKKTRASRSPKPETRRGASPAYLPGHPDSAPSGPSPSQAPNPSVAPPPYRNRARHPVTLTRRRAGQPGQDSRGETRTPKETRRTDRPTDRQSPRSAIKNNENLL